jgi:ATP/maltotriose-dependent transcriptional regulator MalT
MWVQLLESLMVALERDRDCTDPASVLLGDSSPAIDEVIPHLRPTTRGTTTGERHETDRRKALQYELLRALARAANFKPLVFVFDNFQFADDTSLAILRNVSRSLGHQQRLLTVFTCRSGFEPGRPSFSRTVSALVHETGVTEIPLQPFTPEEVGEYLNTCGVTPAGDLVDALFHKTAGHPFFLSMFVAPGRDGCYDLMDRLDPALTLSVQERIIKHIRARLELLSEETRCLLTAAAVIGREFSLDELVIVAEPDYPESRARDYVNSAISQSFLEELSVGGSGKKRYRIAHELVRTAILEAADDAVTAEQHMRAGTYLYEKVLENPCGLSTDLFRGKYLARAGEHYIATGRPELIRKGITLALEGGDLFMSLGGWEEAEALFLRIRNENRQVLSPEETSHIDHRIGTTLLFSSRKFDAYPYLRSAVEYAAGVRDYERIVDIALQPTSHEIGHTPYLEVLDRALEALPDTHPQRVRVLAFYAAALALTTGDYEKSLRILVEKKVVERLVGDERLRARVFLAFLFVRLSDHGTARSLVQDVLADVSTASDPVAMILVTRVQYELAIANGRIHRAREALNRRSHALQVIGDRRLQALTSLMQGRLSLKEGDWSIARNYFDSARRSDPEYSLVLSNLVLLECAAGKYDTAEEILHELIEPAEAEPPGPFVIFFAAASALVTHALIGGSSNDTGRMNMQLHQASRLLRRLPSDGTEHPFITSRRLVLEAIIAYYTRRTGDAERLLAEIDGLNHANTLEPGHLYRSRGLLWCLAGDARRGKEHLYRAISEYRSRKNTLYAVVTEGEYAAECAEADSAEVLNTCVELGFVGLADRFRLSVGGSSVTSLRSLTERERQVLNLLVAGMSDKEIAAALSISVHTASNHVRHILRKTGCGNRTQVVAACGHRQFTG